MRRLELIAANFRRLQEETAGAFAVLQGAATSDPEIAAAQREASNRRHQDMALLAHSLAEAGALQPGVIEEAAADLLWAMTAPDWYRMLVVERDWSAQQYQAWQLFSLSAFLLPASASAPPDAPLA